jgi:hypothetical protein
MEETTMNDLLDAVDALTKPSRRKVIQDDGKTVTVVDLPLIEWLEQSIRATIGIGGSGSLPNERNMLDADALFQFSKITSVIKDWARAAGIDYQREATPITLLHGWYPRYMASNPSDESINFHTKMLSKWAWQIEAKSDPPKVADLPNRCPICDAETWWKDALQYARPLVIHYRENGETDLEAISHGKAMCRACEQVWGVRELAREIELLTESEVVMRAS